MVVLMSGASGAKGSGIMYWVDLAESPHFPIPSLTSRDLIRWRTRGPGVFQVGHPELRRCAGNRVVRLLTHDRWTLASLPTRPGEGGKSRAPRVDEAVAVLDVQMLVSNMPKRSADLSDQAVFFCERALTVSWTYCSTGWPLNVTWTEQHLGRRWWWECPICGRRARYLYFFHALDEVQGPGTVQGVLGCRACLGLTYASRSRHRCADRDRVKARQHDVAAVQRMRRRARAQVAGDARRMRSLIDIARKHGLELPWGS